MYRSIVSANYDALKEFDGTSCGNDNDNADSNATFLHIKAPPIYRDDGAAEWWVEADACLCLSAGDYVWGDTEVWVEKRVLED